MSKYYTLKTGSGKICPVTLPKAIKAIIRDPQSSIQDETGRIVLAKADIIRPSLPLSVSRSEVQA